MKEAGLRGRNGQPIAVQMIYRIIHNSAYRGEAHSGLHKNAIAHEPIVEAATWQQAQFPRPKPRHSIDGVLAGLVRCATCGRLMAATRPQTRSSRSDSYRCVNRATRQCAAPAATRADELEPVIEELLMSLVEGQRAGGEDAQVAAGERAVQTARGDLASYRDNPRLLRTLGAASFESGVAVRQGRLERRLLELARAKRAASGPNVEVEGLRERWGKLSLAQRRAVMAEFLDCIYVERGSEPIGERVWVCRRGRGPTEEGEKVRPYDPAEAKGTKLRAPRRWPEAQIEEELREFIGERKEWPEYADFAHAGVAQLYGQLMRWGGPYFWAHRLGLAIAPGSVLWNDARVGDALAPLMRRRRRWPTPKEFEAVGLGPVRQAIPHHGGVVHWAAAFGVKTGYRNRTWSPARVESELGEFLAGRARYPSKPEFEAAGRRNLYLAARSHGGQQGWERHFGLRRAVRAKK
jgi:hypothetical protein